jgi:hypothetical protein
MDRLYEIVGAPDGTVYVAAKGTNNIVRFAWPNRALSASHGRLDSVERMAMADDGRLLALVAGSPAGLWRITPDLSVAERLVPVPFIDLAVDHERRVVIAAGRVADFLLVRQMDSGVDRRYPLTGGWLRMKPASIALAPRRGKVFVTSWTPFANFHLISADLGPDGTLVNFRRKLLGAEASGMAVDEQRGRLYVARPFLPWVDVLRLDDLERIARYPAPLFARELALSDDNSLLFVASFGLGDLYVVRAADGVRCATYFAGYMPRGMSFLSRQQAVAVACDNEAAALPLADLPAACFVGAN